MDHTSAEAGTKGKGERMSNLMDSSADTIPVLVVVFPPNDCVYTRGELTQKIVRKTGKEQNDTRRGRGECAHSDYTVVSVH